MIDLSPLLQLEKLRKLDCSQCRFDYAPPKLWDMPSLHEVILFKTELPGVPMEVLSPSDGESCLERLRAHFSDLKGDESEIADFKLVLKTPLRGDRRASETPLTLGSTKS